jgi:hypothetical protein
MVNAFRNVEYFRVKVLIFEAHSPVDLSDESSTAWGDKLLTKINFNIRKL